MLSRYAMLHFPEMIMTAIYGHLLHIIRIQGLIFTSFKKFMNLVQGRIQDLSEGGGQDFLGTKN